MDTPAKIGILGGGMMAQVGHLPFYLSDPRCEVVSVCESRPSLVDALGQQLDPKRIVADPIALFENRDIQAIVISAPRPATGPLTLAALNAGKHVMTEKPMAHSVGQAQQLVSAAASRPLIYAIGFMKRYDPGVQAAKALFDKVVAEGRLGRLLLARFYDFSTAYAVTPPPHVRPKESRTRRFPTWPLYPSWLPDGYRSAFAWFLNVASHDINLVHFFFPRGVEAVSAHCAGDASVVAILRREEVTIVLEVAKTAVGRWVEGIDFLFERGRIRVNIPSPMATDAVSQVILDDEHRKIAGASMTVGRGWSFALQASGFLDALLGRALPLTSGEQGLADMILIERIWQRVVAR
jgi:predicted dehydrogenase